MRRKYFERDFYEVIGLLVEGKGKEQVQKRVAVRFTDPIQAAGKMKEFGAGAKCVHHKEQVMTEELSAAMLLGTQVGESDDVSKMRSLLEKIMGPGESPQAQLEAMGAGVGRGRK